MIFVCKIEIQEKTLRAILTPTAYNAIRNIEKEDEKFHKLLHTIFDICELAGFEIEGRIILIDKNSGKIWR